jgi:hypothetical protein
MLHAFLAIFCAFSQHCFASLYAQVLCVQDVEIQFRTVALQTFVRGYLRAKGVLTTTSTRSLYLKAMGRLLVKNGELKIGDNINI